MRHLLRAMALTAALLATGCSSSPGRHALPADNAAQLPEPRAESAAGPAPIRPEATRGDPDSLPADGNESDTAALLYHLLVADIAAQRDRYAIAAQHYMAAARLRKDPQLARLAAQMGLYSRDMQLATALTEEWANIESASADPYQILTALSLQTGDEAKTRQYLGELLQRKQLSTSTDYLELAHFFADPNEAGANIDALEQLVTLRPDDPQALYAYAITAAGHGQVSAALKRSAHLVALRPDWDQGLLLHARLLGANGDKQAALDLLEALLRNGGEHHEARLLRARLLVDLQRLPQAYAAFGELLQQAKEDPDLLFAHALVGLQMGRLETARHDLSALAKLEPTAGRAVFYLGQVAERQGRTEQAIAWYRKVETDEYQVRAALRGADLLANLGKLEPARALLHQVSATEKTDQVTLIGREAALLVTAGQAEQAVALLHQALDTFPDEPQLRFGLAMAYEALDQIEPMTRLLTALIADNPEDANALNALGYALADRGLRLQEAAELIDRALQLEPDNPYILDSKGWLAFRQGDHETALRYLRRASVLLPDAEIFAHLGEVLWKSGQTEAAREVLEQALRSKPADPHLTRLREQFAH